jgi:hypothetical protein
MCLRIQILQSSAVWEIQVVKIFIPYYLVPAVYRAGILNRLWGLGTKGEYGYRIGPSDYIGWRNSFLGIDSLAPETFKNTGSVYRKQCIHLHSHVHTYCMSRLVHAGP